MVSSQVNRWLNISAAFDTIDTDKLLLRIESDFGVFGLASVWIRSYITGRSCYVAIKDLRSDVWSSDSGVLREASSYLSSSLPSYPPSQGSWSPTESGFINTQTILNSTRRSAPRFRLKWRLSHNVSRR